MSNINADGVVENNRKWLLVLSVFVLFAGLLAFYLLPSDQLLLRGLALGIGFLLACALALLSGPGKSFIAFSGDAYREVRKVVWPSRKETGQTTLVVFAFVLVMSVFLWAVDKLAEWSIFSFVLGWK